MKMTELPLLQVNPFTIKPAIGGAFSQESFGKKHAGDMKDKKILFFCIAENEV